MRIVYLALIPAFVIGATGVPQAYAIGCASGAAAGAVAGHLAHHHAILGAAGGCIAGHEINKHDKKLQQQQNTQNSAP